MYWFSSHNHRHRVERSFPSWLCGLDSRHLLSEGDNQPLTGSEVSGVPEMGSTAWCSTNGDRTFPDEVKEKP